MMRRRRGDWPAARCSYQRARALPLWYLRQSQAISIRTRRAQLFPAFEMPWQREVVPLS
jgi:hypothetical protein